MKPTLVAAADAKYFLEHGEAFVRSAIEHNNDYHVLVINPNSECFDLIEKITGNAFDEKNFSSVIVDEADRVYYACARFLFAPWLLKRFSDILILDIDCFIRGTIDIPENMDYGLYLRDPLPGTTGYENYATHVAAGAVYINERAIEYARVVHDFIEKNKLQWFIDQFALYHVHQMNEKAKLWRFWQIPQTYIDWEFQENSLIWTGKGDRKYSNSTYLEGKKKYESGDSKAKT